MASSLKSILGIELPIIQAPMAGVQGSGLAIAVSNAGGLGSLPCATLSPEALRQEMTHIAARTTGPYNVNFFCHTPPVADADREAAWRAALTPYYTELGLDVSTVPTGGGRTPFNADAASILEAFKPKVVSFHFGLPSPGCSHASARGARRSSPRRRPWPKLDGSKRAASMPSSRKDSKQAVTADTSCPTT